MKTFPFGLILMGHISVFLVNDPKSMNFFITSKSFALAVVILYSKNGDSESVLLKESFYTGMTSGQISYIVEVTRPEKLIRHIPWDVLPRR